MNPLRVAGEQEERGWYACRSESRKSAETPSKKKGQGVNDWMKGVEKNSKGVLFHRKRKGIRRKWKQKKKQSLKQNLEKPLEANAGQRGNERFCEGQVT